MKKSLLKYAAIFFLALLIGKINAQEIQWAKYVGSLATENGGILCHR